jgi:hypothetical protein
MPLRVEYSPDAPGEAPTRLLLFLDDAALAKIGVQYRGSGARGWRRGSSSGIMPACSFMASLAMVSIGCGRTIGSRSSGTWRSRCGSSLLGSTRVSGGPTSRVLAAFEDLDCATLLS